MRHTVTLQGVIVGHSDLEYMEPDVGRAWGAFRPGLGYDLVQPVFRLFSAAVTPQGETTDAVGLARYHAARDAMKLELVDGDGRAIRTSVIHIADYMAEQGPGAVALDVLIRDDAYWTRRVAVPDAQ